MKHIGRWMAIVFFAAPLCIAACSHTKDTTPDDWVVFKNEAYGYSFNIPANCILGPMPSDCKQKPPEVRDLACLCFLNAENPNEIYFQSFLGEGNSTLAGFSVSHFNTPLYYPPEETDLIEWLQVNFSERLDGMPDVASMEIDGIPAVTIFRSASPTAGAYKEIYFLKDERLFRIQMVDVLEEDNRELYDQVLSSFRFDK